MDKKEITNIDEYINQFSGEIRIRLVNIRQLIKKIEPRLEERMSWQMPTFWLKKNIIHFAVSKNHIGIYPGSGAVLHFQYELQDYKTSKGAIQFPHKKSIPYDLIEEIVKYNLNN